MKTINLTQQQANDLVKIIDHYQREVLDKMCSAQTRETERALQEEAQIADRLKTLIDKA